MSQFGNLYAQYYDLLYLDKDYRAEVNYINSLIRSHLPQAASILDLGCGTGRHAELFCEQGYTVHGIDLSVDMLLKAEQRRVGKENKLSFSHSDIQSTNLNKKYDVVASLFHVMSYQNSNQELINAFDVARKHLVDGGLFIFDFWYGPAVLLDLPTTRVKRLENNSVKVIRYAEPVLHVQQNIVDVNYEIMMLDKKLNQADIIHEQHKMRYLFDTELEIICQNVGFSVLDKFLWLSKESPSFNSWNVVWVVQK